jgi:hypothetical protein
MRTLRVGLLIALSMNVPLTGCGGDGGSAPSLDTICEEEGLYADLYAKAFECEPLFQVIFGTVSRAELSTVCYGALSPYLEDGTVTIGDSAAFTACADFLATADCEDLGRRTDDPCQGVLVGTVESGGLCDSDDQCVGDAYCDRPDVTMCGSCTARKADGAACMIAEECQSERCAMGGTCQPLVAVGGTCDRDLDCLGRAYCSDTGACTAQGTWAVGSPCDSVVEDCGSFVGGLYCDPGTNQCATVAQIGETCTPPGMGGPLCNIFGYEHCEETTPGTFECQPPVIVNQGDDCDIFAGTKCAEGLTCEDHDNSMTTPNQCITPLQEGATCLEANPLCDFLLNCVDGVCQYGDYTGICPAPAMP